MKNITKISLIIFALITKVLCFQLVARPGMIEKLYDTRVTNQLILAERDKDINMIIDIFDDSALFVIPDALPIYGKEAIVSIYQHIWRKGELTTIDYKNDSIEFSDNKIIEKGFYHFMEKNKESKLPYEVVFKKIGDRYKILEIIFGNAIEDSKLPKLLKPTGEYIVGRSVFFYEKEDTDINRILSFEIWYPANHEIKKKAYYQSKEVCTASAEFLGWPLFSNSYFALMFSNSFFNVPAFPDKHFPVVIYNHGYSGFSSVYQTVFEELASHGYIVVSIAHENESAILIKEDMTVIKTDRENKFFKSHSIELNGQEINSLQNVILNSNNTQENTKAYKSLIKISPIHNKSTRLWAQDTRAVIKKLKIINNKSKNLRRIFDFTRVGVMGHSVGGATAGQLAVSPETIKAGINLDGFQFGDLINQKIKVPFMFVSSNARGNSYLRFSTFINKSGKDCFHAIIKGFSHDSFSDLSIFKTEGESVIKLQRELITTFFNIYLKAGNKSNLKNLEQKFKKLSIKLNRGFENRI